eukprot:6967401-Alexandrium_andersonii.AAC.1
MPDHPETSHLWGFGSHSRLLYRVGWPRDRTFTLRMGAQPQFGLSFWRSLASRVHSVRLFTVSGVPCVRLFTVSSCSWPVH